MQTEATISVSIFIIVVKMCGTGESSWRDPYTNGFKDND